MFFFYKRFTGRGVLSPRVAVAWRGLGQATASVGAASKQPPASNTDSAEGGGRCGGGATCVHPALRLRRRLMSGRHNGSTTLLCVLTSTCNSKLLHALRLLIVELENITQLTTYVLPSTAHMASCSKV